MPAIKIFGHLNSTKVSHFLLDMTKDKEVLYKGKAGRKRRVKRRPMKALHRLIEGTEGRQAVTIKGVPPANSGNRI